MRSNLVAYSLYVKNEGKGKGREREITKIVSPSSTFFLSRLGRRKKIQGAEWWEGETRRNQMYSSAVRLIKDTGIRMEKALHSSAVLDCW